MRPRIPILVVTHSLDRGGTEQHLLQVFSRIDKQRFGVSILPLYRRGKLMEDFSRAGLIAGSGKESRMAAITSLAGIALRTHPIVHCFLPEAYLLGMPIARLFGAAAVLMSRRNRNHYQERHPVASWIERRLHHHVAALVGNSEAIVSDLREEGVPPEKIRLIRNGIDLSAYPSGEARDIVRGRMRACLGVRNDRLLIVCVANLFPYKGHMDLLQAMFAMPTCVRGKCHLLLVGRDAGMQSILSQESVRLGLANDISFLGERSDVPDILAACDIGVLASHEEGFSNAILECMASGLPLVVSDVGGNSEAVADGLNGYVVPAGNPVALSKTLSVLIERPEVRVTMGGKGRIRASQSFSLDQCVASYEALYEEFRHG